MRQLLPFIAAVTLAMASSLAHATPADPKNGVEYLTLPQAQPTEAGAKVGEKIEVTEFFAYYCPHCHSLEPVLAAWVKRNSERIVFKRVHVARGPQVAPQQRLFFTLEAMGLEQYHGKVFEAMHGPERNRLNTDEVVFDWASKNGIDRAKFIDTYRSLGVAAQVRRADAMMASYRVDSWPLIAVDGRYVTSPYQASSALASGTESLQQQAALIVLDHLVSKAKATAHPK